jgi:hypothetical protein
MAAVEALSDRGGPHPPRLDVILRDHALIAVRYIPRRASVCLCLLSSRCWDRVTAGTDEKQRTACVGRRKMR